MLPDAMRKSANLCMLKDQPSQGMIHTCNKSEKEKVNTFSSLFILLPPCVPVNYYESDFLWHQKIALWVGLLHLVRTLEPVVDFSFLFLYLFFVFNYF